jgi:hypothetical protein
MRLAALIVMERKDSSPAEISEPILLSFGSSDVASVSEVNVTPIECIYCR